MTLLFYRVGKRVTTSMAHKESINRHKKIGIMKSVKCLISRFSALALILLLSISVKAQIGGWNPYLENNARQAMNIMSETRPQLACFKKNAYASLCFHA